MYLSINSADGSAFSAALASESRLLASGTEVAARARVVSYTGVVILEFVSTLSSVLFSSVSFEVALSSESSDAFLLSEAAFSSVFACVCVVSFLDSVCVAV